MPDQDEHLTNTQFLLLKLDIGLASKEKRRWQAHLDTCSKCRHESDDFDDRFDEQARARKNLDLDLATDLMCLKQEKLADYSEAFLERLFQSLLQVEATTRIAWLFPSLEQARRLPLTVPEDLKDSIYDAIKPKWQVLVAALKSRVAEVIKEGDETIDRFVIEIMGFRPAPAAGVLLDEKAELPERGIPIQHKGGDLQLQVGGPQIKVELYSEEEGEEYLLIAEAVSNQAGLVRFERIWKGNYRLLLLAEAGAP